jgi:hypothetical protein
MRDTDHHIRHPRGHLGDRVSARWTSGCAQRDDKTLKAIDLEALSFPNDGLNWKLDGNGKQLQIVTALMTARII